MKIVAFESEEWEHGAFAALGAEHEVLFTPGALTAGADSRYSDADAISTFIYSDVSAAVMEQFPKLRIVATRSTGYDHIDLEYCRRNGVAVCNVPSYADRTVAEHVFALLLAISRNLVEASDRTRRGDFTQSGLQGFDLEGKTMGVIGTGNIGKCVIEIARGFRMEVIAFDKNPDQDAASSIGYRYVSMDELLRTADIITLHVPGTEQTRHLISASGFSKMKSGVILINTARGDVVHTPALLEALVDRKIAGAGLDVLPEEPTIREESELIRSIFSTEHNLGTLLADHMLHHLTNVVITPHCAFNTREAVQRLLDVTAGNIDAYYHGRPQNVVN